MLIFLGKICFRLFDGGWLGFGRGLFPSGVRFWAPGSRTSVIVPQPGPIGPDYAAYSASESEDSDEEMEDDEVVEAEQLGVVNCFGVKGSGLSEVD